MRILALETTDKTGSIAALDGPELLLEAELPAHQRSAQSLAPAMAELLAKVGWKATDVELIAVAVGPGSFTGLRVGVTTAKVLAYVARSAVVGVNTLEAIAWQAPAEVNDLWAVLDAQRQEVVAGRLVRDSEGTWRWSRPAEIYDNVRWAEALQPGDHVTGPGLKKLAAEIPPGVILLDEGLWQPKASTIGALGWHMHQCGHREDLWALKPQYFRVSAAEEKRAERDAQQAADKS